MEGNNYYIHEVEGESGVLDEEEENIQIQHNQRVLASLTQWNYYAEVSPAH